MGRREREGGVKKGGKAGEQGSWGEEGDVGRQVVGGIFLSCRTGAPTKGDKQPGRDKLEPLRYSRTGQNPFKRVKGRMI